MPPETTKPLTVNGALPVLLIVRIAVAVEPTCTEPNARFPLNPMTRVDVGVRVGVGAVGLLLPPTSRRQHCENKRDGS